MPLIPCMAIILDDLKRVTHFARYQEKLFIEKEKRYTDITELIAELVHLFIDRIVVGKKAESYLRIAEQCVWMCYCDIRILDDGTKENNISETDYEFIADNNGE